MGINFVIYIENVAKRTQEEIDAELGQTVWDDGTIIKNRWTLVPYKGKEYAEWLSTPRYFIKDEEPERWEAMRKYLVRAMNFFGASAVFESNDVLCSGIPPEDLPEEEAEPYYYLPFPMYPDYLKEPDYEEMPELRNIKELEGLRW